MTKDMGDTRKLAIKAKIPKYMRDTTDALDALHRLVHLAVADEREACAKVCDEYSLERWKAYKTGYSLERALPQTEGRADGAEACSKIIRSRGGEGAGR